MTYLSRSATQDQGSTAGAGENFSLKLTTKIDYMSLIVPLKAGDGPALVNYARGI